MNTITNLKDIFEDLKQSFPKISDADLLKAAAQVQNTQAIREAFLLDWSGEMSALESIAVMLGKKPKTEAWSQTTIPEAINDAVEAIIEHLPKAK